MGIEKTYIKILIAVIGLNLSLFTETFSQITLESADSLIEASAPIIIPEHAFPEIDDTIIEARLALLQKDIKLSYNQTIRGFIKYFTVRNRRYPLVMERRRNLYFPIFEEALKRHNMPEELKYLAIVESGLNPRAVSRMGAAGLWQFMPSTGKMYKLRQDEYVDERLDPYKSTEAACKYLKELHRIFNDWELALASYNCGPGNVRRAIRKSGYKDSFWEVYKHLPQETRAYVPQFVALTYVMNHLEDHNIIADSIEYPIAFDTITVNHFMNLDALCGQLSICAEEFMKLNPAIKKNTLPNHIGYTIRIPSDKTQMLASNRASIMDSCSKTLNPTLTPNENESLNIALEAAKLAVPTKRESSQKKSYHLVKSGENLGRIADKYNVHIATLKKWNNIRGNNIKKGQKLIVYKEVIANHKTHVAAKTETHVEKARKSTRSSLIHYVQPGDTLWTISRKYDGISIDKIRKLNKLKGNEIKIGQKLILG